MIWPMRGFVIDGDEAHIYYAGLTGLHGDPGSDTPVCDGAFEGSFCRARTSL